MQRDTIERNRVRQGFSIVELLVSLVVMGLLLSLLLPAVQHARAVSRIAVCRNNLRQIGIALQTHHEQFGQFPSIRYRLELLPALEMSALYAECRSKLLIVSGWANPGIFSHFPFLVNASIPVYACPSDPHQKVSRGRYSSYPMTSVAFFGDHVAGLYPRSSDPVRARDVTDGLSNTGAFSEKVLSTSETELDAPTRRVELTRTQRLMTPATVDQVTGDDQLARFVRACTAAEYSLPKTPVPAYFFLSVDGFSGGYNHVLPPNANSCWNGIPDVSPWSTTRCAISATSLHTGGVNLLFCDGSARFMSESVDVSVWQALGTRNGGEVVPAF